MSDLPTGAMKHEVCVAITARPSYYRVQVALSAVRAHPAPALQFVAAMLAPLARYGAAERAIEAEGFGSVSAYT